MKKTLITLYVIVAVATFGHAWNRDYANLDEPLQQAKALTAAPFCAALWPLYWSAWAWKQS